MRGIQQPRMRPYQNPYVRVTLAPVSVMVPSISHPVHGASQQGASDAQHWTPHGTLTAVTLPWHAWVTGGVGRAARGHGGYYTSPALWQILGIPDRNLILQVKPAAGRTGTPPVRHMAINPFPSVRPPLPSYPLPAAWPGSF